MGLSVEFCKANLFLRPFLSQKYTKTTPLENLVSTGVVYGSFFTPLSVPTSFSDGTCAG